MRIRLKSGLLIAAVAALTILPVTLVKQPSVGPGGTQPELFKGSDDQASAAVHALAPSYKPWFSPIFKTDSSETDTLLFALQAAIGAGFIGYYAGYSRGRTKDDSTKPVGGPYKQDKLINGSAFCRESAETKIERAERAN